VKAFVYKEPQIKKMHKETKFEQEKGKGFYLCKDFGR